MHDDPTPDQERISGGPNHPDQHQKELVGRIEDYEHELEQVSARLAELQQLIAAHSSALDVYQPSQQMPGRGM